MAIAYSQEKTNVDGWVHLVDVDGGNGKAVLTNVHKIVFLKL
jgi:hypothetical protein